MRIAHSQSISFARIHENNRTILTYHATCISRLLRAVLRVPGKPTKAKEGRSYLQGSVCI